MMNYIWGAMILIAIIVSIFTGRIEETVLAATEGAKSGVETSIGLLGIMCLWTGIARIGEKAGMIKAFAKVLKPIIKLLFPKIKADGPAASAMVLNMVANFMGMGNAATPLGINATKELHKLNGYKAVASNEMCMFVVINTASLQLIPTTIISLRQGYGATSPAEIFLPVWMVSIAALVVGVTVAKILEKRSL